MGGEPCQPHPGTQCHRYGCSLPGLTRFTADCCGGTDGATITRLPEQQTGAIVAARTQVTTAEGKKAASRPGLPAGKRRHGAGLAVAKKLSRKPEHRFCEYFSLPATKPLTKARLWIIIAGPRRA